MPRHSDRHRGRHGRRRSRSGSPTGHGGHHRGHLEDNFFDSLFSRFFRRTRNNRRMTYANIVTYRGNEGAASGALDKPEKPDPSVVLTVKSLDLQIPANSRLHRTDEYDVCNRHSNPHLVVRRGQTFNIQLDFSRPYDQAADDLRIAFEAGDDPNPAKGTEVEMILSDDDKPKEWGAKILKQQGNSLTVTIFTPPTCYVGKWELSIDVVKKDQEDVKVYRYEHDDPIYIIFNPWCKDDSVYLEDELLLQEYVLNETGRIFTGSKNNISSRPWNFGQFESCVLDVALYLLDISRLSWTSRGNPIPVTRKLSAAVNSSDEGGVLTGNWSGDYSGGRSPLSWSGSVDILEQYWQSRRPVKYGQCWVFSGVSTTIARALGIPARSITNFASAHDTDGSITIDLFYDKDGQPEDNNPDSIWNFHVWNEAWMSRPDLPTGFGGWQAFDATPQEASDGVYCCGPVSVAAIRQGEVNVPYDGPFVFAEVNADRVYWMPDSTGKLKNMYMEKAVVGKNISTKLPNNPYQREDVTGQYKPKEGSADERAAVLRANQLCSTRSDTYTRQAEDVKFTVEHDTENCWVGDDFKAYVTVSNTSKHSRQVSGRVVVKTMFYTGVAADRLLTAPFSITLGSGETHKVPVVAQARVYVDKLQDCAMLDVSVWATVRETNQVFVTKEDYRLRKPHLSIKGPSEGVKGTEFDMEVSFTNPLDISLTDCVLTVDGLAKSLRFPQKNVGAKGTFVTTIPVTPYKVGQKELILVFSSKQLDDINASKKVFVRGPNVA